MPNAYCVPCARCYYELHTCTGLFNPISSTQKSNKVDPMIFFIWQRKGHQSMNFIDSKKGQAFYTLMCFWSVNLARPQSSVTQSNIILSCCCECVLWMWFESIMNWLEVRVILLDNLGVNDAISWKALIAELWLPWHEEIWPVISSFGSSPRVPELPFLTAHPIDFGIF